MCECDALTACHKSDGNMHPHRAWSDIQLHSTGCKVQAKWELCKIFSVRGKVGQIGA